MHSIITTRDEGPFNKYFHMMLNMDDDDLDPFEYRLMGHYRRVGVCKESIWTTAKKCQMSVAKARETRNALKARGCIRFDGQWDRETLTITVVDRMSLNVSRYSPIKSNSPPLSNPIAKEEPSKKTPESTDTSLSTENVSVSQPSNSNASEAGKKQDEGQSVSQPSLFATDLPKVANCYKCKVERTWVQHSGSIYRCEVCGSLVAANILWPEKSQNPTLYITGKKSDDEGFSKRGRKVKTLWYIFRMVDGKNVYIGPAPTEKAARELLAAGDGTMTMEVPADATVLPWPKKERKPNAWDVLGEAIATHLFGAKDKAGVNAVFGRVGPILHGDKRSGRCEGLIAYECEKQGKDKADLDYKALADLVPQFWKAYQLANPGVTQLKDCAKVLDAWQAWRGKPVKVSLSEQYVPVLPDDYK